MNYKLYIWFVKLQIWNKLNCLSLLFSGGVVSTGRVVNVSEETDHTYSEDGYDPEEMAAAADIAMSIQDLNISSSSSDDSKSERVCMNINHIDKIKGYLLKYGYYNC